jgi:hypothetical protein
LFRGLVRPIVTFAFAGGVLFGFLAGMIQPGEFLALVGPVIGFWFSERTKTATPTGGSV